MNAINDPLVIWPVYEPAGQKPIAFDAEALVQHVCIIGSSGSGKSTLLTSAAQQLIRHRPQPIGLLVLDAKQEGMVERVTEAAHAAGREGDLVILGPQGTHVLDLFGRLKTLDDVDTVTQWLLLASDKVGGDNPYWQNSTASMISAALTLLCVRRKSPVTYSAAVEFMRCWFLGLDSGESLPKPVADAVERAKRESSKPACSPQLLGALDHVELWRKLDSRTKSNLQSCLLNVLRPLMGVAASRCFDANDRLEFSPAEVAEGRLCANVAKLRSSKFSGAGTFRSILH